MAVNDVRFGALQFKVNRYLVQNKRTVDLDKVQQGQKLLYLQGVLNELSPLLLFSDSYYPILDANNNTITLVKDPLVSKTRKKEMNVFEKCATTFIQELMQVHNNKPLVARVMQEKDSFVRNVKQVKKVKDKPFQEELQNFLAAPLMQTFVSFIKN